MTLELKRPQRKPPAPPQGCTSAISLPAPPGPLLPERTAVVLALAQSSAALAVVLATSGGTHITLAVTVFTGAFTFFSRAIG